MGSRIGSIVIFVVIFGIVAVVAALIVTLDLLNTNDPDAPIVLVSIDDGELVLLEDPQSITVTISSGSPIATLELFIDGESLVSVLPSYSPDRGAYIGSFVWTPTRLGFAQLRIVALDAEGVETERQIRVEVTDDAARVAAALRLQVLGISPLQQFITGSTISLAIRATGSQEIARFDMFVNGERITSVTPVLHDGAYVANIDWTAGETGEVDVTFTAVDITGREESLTIPIVLIQQGGAPLESTDADADDSEAETPDGEDAAPTGIGSAQIDSPQDQQRFTLGDAFDVEISAPTVTVASALLYLTPVSPDGTLGNSVLVHSSDGADGEYSEVVENVERWIAGSGSYQLQLVVFTPEDDRYDDLVVIHVVAEADAADEPSDEQEEAQEDEPAQEISDDVDLAIVTARQDADDLARLNVTITNASTVDIERTDVLLTVIDSVTGAELGAAAVTLSMDAEGIRSIPLELDLQPSVDFDALIVLEAALDTDPSNNTFQVQLAAPDADAPEDSDELSPEAHQEEDADEPVARPDLTFLDTQSTRDGFVLFTVVNEGDAPAESFFIVISDSGGDELEIISRRAADDNPLDVGAVEILTSQQAHSGDITITLVTSGAPSEDNLANNDITLTLPE